MADVKWIKITTDMFNNSKIRHLRKLPEGNSVVLIWVMLLTMAGRCNAGGMVFLTENIPYTSKMLADELDFEENTVQLAISALERLGMIRSYDDGFLSIEGWEEHQNIEGMERIRESKRLAQARWRAKKKALPDYVDDYVDSTEKKSGNADIDKEEDKEIESNNKGKTQKRFTPPTLEEVKAYCAERNNSVDAERWLDYYTANGWMVGKNKMRDWKAAVRTWEKNGYSSKPEKPKKETSFDMDLINKRFELGNVK